MKKLEILTSPVLTAVAFALCGHTIIGIVFALALYGVIKEDICRDH